MVHPIIYWVAAHGYGVIFALFALGIVGLPVPDEWLLAYLGNLIYKGRLLPAPAFAAAFLGSITGMTVNYLLGRTFGLYLVRNFGRFARLTPEKMSTVHAWYEHSGRWALMMGYFLRGCGMFRQSSRERQRCHSGTSPCLPTPEGSSGRAPSSPSATFWKNNGQGKRNGSIIFSRAAPLRCLSSVRVIFS